MESVPKPDLLLNVRGEIKLRVLAIDEDFRLSIADAGIRDSKLPLQGQRHHTLGRLPRFAIPDIFSRHVNFHVLPLPAALSRSIAGGNCAEKSSNKWCLIAHERSSGCGARSHFVVHRL